jgi:hypothetical protein
MLARIRKRWWLNLALIALLGGLVLFAIYQPGKKPPESAPKLTTLATDAITRVRIERSGQEAIVLEKSATGWRLKEPIAARANSFNVESLLRVAGADVNATIANGEQTLGQFGLDTPRARVWLDDEEFAFGDLHPLKNQVYVRYRKQVYLIPSHLFGPAGYDFRRYLASRLLEEDRKPVSFKLPGFAVVLKDGSWQREPADKDLTGDRINDFVREWQYASALDVDRYSGQRVLGRIDIAFAGEGDKTQTLSLGILSYKPEFVLYRQDEGLEYRFPEETGKRLLTLAAEPKEAGAAKPAP